MTTTIYLYQYEYTTHFHSQNNIKRKKNIANFVYNYVMVHGTLWKWKNNSRSLQIFFSYLIIEITTTTFTFYKTIFDTKLFWWSKFYQFLCWTFSLHFIRRKKHQFHWKRIFSNFFFLLSSVLQKCIQNRRNKKKTLNGCYGCLIMLFSSFRTIWRSIRRWKK